MSEIEDWGASTMHGTYGLLRGWLWPWQRRRSNKAPSIPQAPHVSMDSRYIVVEDSTIELSGSDLESLPEVQPRGEVWEMSTRERSDT